MNGFILIPSLCPDDKMIQFIKELKNNKLENIIVVDDGSGKKYSNIFKEAEKIGAIVISYEVNLGKGMALKTGMKYIKENFDLNEIEYIVTADSDGQHHADDIKNVIGSFNKGDELILGVRDFNSSNVPPRSKVGNRFSSFYFKVVTELSCPDTQTGLRLIPTSLLDLALEIPGERYEYEMNFLIEVGKSSKRIVYIPIKTIYENENKGSHFRFIRDSARIYQTPLKFASVSIFSAIIDLGIFNILNINISKKVVFPILIATVVARIISGSLNFILNHYWCFKCKDTLKKPALKYGILFLIQMCLSWLFVGALSFIRMPLVIVKFFVDIMLFIFSYYVQLNWVFKSSKSKRVK